jgi:hypothetical protein
VAELATNGAASTLDGAITADALELSIQSGDTGQFPSTGTFALTIVDAINGTEIVEVTAVSGATFTVTRASEPFAGLRQAFAHASGTAVGLYPTVGTIKALTVGGASANEVELTTTAQTEIVTYTPATAGPLTVGVYIRVTVAATVEAHVEYTDAGGSQTAVLVPSLELAPGSYLYPVAALSSTASAITVYATASVASQVFVSSFIR